MGHLFGIKFGNTNIEMMNEKLIELLKKPDTISDLRFQKIVKEEDDVITVNYYGHEEGGSYVYAKSVAPKYVEDLEFTTNRKVEWIGHSCGHCFGADEYTFKVYTKWVLDSNKYEPKGTLHRVANSYFCFEIQGGREWAFLYVMHRAVVNNEVPNKIVTLRKTKKISKDKEVLYFGSTPIAVVVSYEPETWHHFKGHNTSTNRKKFHASYDLLVSASELHDKFYETYRKIVNFLILDSGVTCESVSFLWDDTCGHKIKIEFSNGIIRKVGPEWTVFNEKDANYLKEECKRNLTYINVNLDRMSIWRGLDRERINLEFEVQPTIENVLNYLRLKDRYLKLFFNNIKTSDIQTKLVSKDVLTIEF